MFYKIENKELDLLAAYNRKEGSSKLEKYIKILGAPIILVFIIAMAWVFLFISNSQLQDKITDVKEKNDALQLQIDTSDLEAYNELIALEGTFDSIEKVDSYISNLPKITRGKIRDLQTTLLNGMRITSISYNQTNGQVSLNCISSNVQNIEKYVTVIKRNPDFINVTYKGYQQSSQTKSINTGAIDEITGLPITTQTTSIYYTFNLIVTLGGGE